MKQIAFIAAATVALGVSSPTLSAQAFSNPTGYVTETLKAGQFNLIGLTVHQPIDVAGTFDSVSGTTLTMAGAFGELDSEATYILEITGGTELGALQEVSGATATANSIEVGIPFASLTTSDAFVLRRASTIRDLFGTDNSAGLNEGVSAALADEVWVPAEGGDFNRYYYHPGETSLFGVVTEGWKISGGTVDMPVVPVVYTDALIVKSNGSADIDVVFSGTVKTTNTNIVTTVGDSNFNFISVVSPVGVTLDSSGLENIVNKANEATADYVYVSDGSGGYDIYYFHPGETSIFGTVTAGWKIIGDTATDQAGVALGSAVIIENRSGSTRSGNLVIPSGWSL